MVVINATVECAVECAIGFVGKISSSVGSTVTYTPDFINFVAENYPSLVGLFM